MCAYIIHFVNTTEYNIDDDVSRVSNMTK